MILIAESEQAGVRPGQSAAEENRAGHRALHNQREWVFIFLYIYRYRLSVTSFSVVFRILNELLRFDRNLKRPRNDSKRFHARRGIFTPNRG